MHEGDVVLLVTSSASVPVGAAAEFPLRVGRRVERNALHVVHIQVQVVGALGWLVFFAVEEGALAVGRVQVVTQLLDDLLEGRTHLGVVLPAHLHQVVSGRREASGTATVKIHTFAVRH